MSLCEEAVKTALQKLGDPDVSYRLLSCHLSYYGTQRYESYISIAPTSLAVSPMSPSHILMLIDDVLDLYLRLSGPEQIYNPYFNARTLLAREAVDSGSDSISQLLDRLEKDPNESVYRCLQVSGRCPRSAPGMARAGSEDC